MGDALAEDLLTTDTDQGAILTSVLINAYQCQLTSWYDLWVPEGTTDAQVQTHAFYYHYYRVLLYSFGIQRLSNREVDWNQLSSYCATSFCEATLAIQIAKNWHSRGWLTYAIVPQFVFISYIATFLIKFLDPPYSSLFSRESIVAIVTSVVELLEKASTDCFHVPALYSKSLGLLLRHKQISSVAPSPGCVQEDAELAQGGPADARPLAWDWGVNLLDGEDAAQDSTDPFSWDDIMLPRLGGPGIPFGGPASMWPFDMEADWYPNELQDVPA